MSKPALKILPIKDDLSDFVWTWPKTTTCILVSLFIILSFLYERNIIERDEEQ